MRTTVTIDDQVFRDAKQQAAREGRTLGDLITEALRARLALRHARAEEPYRVLTYGQGGPHPGIDITNNAAVRDLMDEA
jgi:hypothetical protein